MYSHLAKWFAPQQVPRSEIRICLTSGLESRAFISPAQKDERSQTCAALVSRVAAR